MVSKIYVVIGSTVFDNDQVQWLVRAYDNNPQAAQFCNMCTDFGKQLVEKCGGDPSNLENFDKNSFVDPNFEFDVCNSFMYEVQEVDLHSKDVKYVGPF